MSRLIAITGATGFIGQAICRVLHEAGFSIRVLARSPERLKTLPVQVRDVVQGNLHDQQALQSLVAGVDVVIHCAGVVRGANQEDFDRVNVEGLGNLLDAMRSAGHPPRLFYLSSLAAREPELSCYAGSKYRSEQLLAERANEISWLALRPPAVYGPGDRELLPLFKLMSRGLVPVLGDRNARFSMIYVDDIAQLVLAWIQQDISTSGIYTLDDGKVDGYSWDDVGDTVAQLCQRRVYSLKVPDAMLDIAAWVNRGLARLWRYAPMLTPEKLRELRHPDWVCDNQDLKAVIDWQPRYELAEGLKHTPGWCARLGI